MTEFGPLPAFTQEEREQFDFHTLGCVDRALLPRVIFFSLEDEPNQKPRLQNLALRGLAHVVAESPAKRDEFDMKYMGLTPLDIAYNDMQEVIYDMKNAALDAERSIQLKRSVKKSIFSGTSSITLAKPWYEQYTAIKDKMAGVNQA